MDGVGYTRSNPGAFNTLAQSALSGLGAGLGQQAGIGIGNLVGSGLNRLGKATGISGPTKEMIQLLMSQGMSQEDAMAFADLDPKAQQQVLANLSNERQAEQKRNIFGPESETQIADQALKQEEKAESIPESVQPMFMPSSKEMYEQLTRAGVDDKTKNSYLKEYKDEYKELLEEPKAYMKEVKDNAKAAKESTPRLLRMYELVQKGDLSPSQTAAVIKAIDKGINYFVGVDLTSLMNGDSQEFDKLSADFSKLIGDYFPGGKITNIMIQNFMRTIPTLTQSDEGKLRVISNLMNISEAARLTEKATHDILKETNGKIPLNIKDLVQSKIGPQLQELEDHFIKGTNPTLSQFEKTKEQAEFKGRKEAAYAKTGGIGGALSGAALGTALLGPVAGIPLGGTLGGLVGLAGTPNFARDEKANLQQLAKTTNPLAALQRLRR